MKLDDWQKEVLEHDGNICLRSGRQVGKSTVIAVKGAEYALKKGGRTILIISAVERQAYLLLEKVLDYLLRNYSRYVKSGRDRPTKNKVQLKNGSTIYCLPTGLTGYGIRGYTIDMLIADEASFIPEDVWTAVTPMLAVTKGKIILLSTPHGREGYFFRCFSDPTFKAFHISSEECPRVDKEFLKRERERMTKLQYTQEYLGEFIDELRQYFPDELIKKCMINYRQEPVANQEYYLGVDIARMGEDESTFEIIHRIDKDNYRHVENIITKKTLITDTVSRILELEAKWKFKKLYIDDAGLGSGVFDMLLLNDAVKRKVIPINNASRPLDRREEKKKKILKEDLYNNLLALMEWGKLYLLNDDEIFRSLKSVQYEYITETKGIARMRIYGAYTHITEGLVRACWCNRDKSLNIWITSGING